MGVWPDDAGVPSNELFESPLLFPSAVEFRCDVAYFEERAVVGVRGDIDIATATELRHEILAVLALPLRGVVVDLGYVTFMDSSGVAALIAAFDHARERGIEFRVTAVPRCVRLVLELFGLAERFGLTTH